MNERRENLAFLFIAFMFFGIGFSIAKNIYTDKDDFIRIPTLKTGKVNEKIVSNEDSTYRVITYIDSAIVIGEEFDD